MKCRLLFELLLCILAVGRTTAGKRVGTESGADCTLSSSFDLTFSKGFNASIAGIEGGEMVEDLDLGRMEEVEVVSNFEGS